MSRKTETKSEEKKETVVASTIEREEFCKLKLLHNLGSKFCMLLMKRLLQTGSKPCKYITKAPLPPYVKVREGLVRWIHVLTFKQYQSVFPWRKSGSLWFKDGYESKKVQNIVKRHEKALNERAIKGSIVRFRRRKNNPYCSPSTVKVQNIVKII